MKDCEKQPSGVLINTDELKNLISEHPDLPLIVMAGDEANIDDYGYMFCSYVKCELGELLDCSQGIDAEKVYIDRDEFEDELRIYFDDFSGSDDAYEEFIKKELEEYEPYWKKCIILKVDN